MVSFISSTFISHTWTATSTNNRFRCAERINRINVIIKQMEDHLKDSYMNHFSHGKIFKFSARQRALPDDDNDNRRTSKSQNKK